VSPGAGRGPIRDGPMIDAADGYGMALRAVDMAQGARLLVYLTILSI